jgi:hypothetical protein
VLKRASLFIIAVTLFAAVESPAHVFAQAKEDKRAKEIESERKKLHKTTDPANRTKSLIRISEIVLTFINDGAKENDLSKMRSYLALYRQAITDARDTMLGSGLDPDKKSSGYKMVDIALRKQVRALQDIATLLTVDEREPVNEVIAFALKTRDEFLRALFG